jgi:hypothetical protein
MKKLLMGAVGALALLAAAPAYAETGGFVGASYERLDADDAEADGFAINGAAAYDAAPSVGVEVEAGYVDFEETDGSYGVTGHVYSDGGSYKFGGFLGLSDSEDADTFFGGGIEGATHLTNVTLVGALGYGEADETGIWSIDGEARYFVTDNFRLQGKLGYGRVEFDGADDSDLWRYGVGGEFQLDAAPVSLFADVSIFDFEEADEITAFSIGARWNFGNFSLRDRDTMGPTFAGVSTVGSQIGIGAGAVFTASPEDETEAEIAPLT